LLRSEEIRNKSYGGNDIGAKREVIEIRQGRLSPVQIAELAALFVGWESLSSERYGGVADGPDIDIRYGDKTVSGGSTIPQRVQQLSTQIRALAATMQVAGKAKGEWSARLASVRSGSPAGGTLQMTNDETRMTNQWLQKGGQVPFLRSIRVPDPLIAPWPPYCAYLTLIAPEHAYAVIEWYRERHRIGRIDWDYSLTEMNSYMDITHDEAKQLAEEYVEQHFGRKLEVEMVFQTRGAWVVSFRTGKTGLLESCAVRIEPSTRECQILHL
jgi:hypothetical protein